MKRPDAIMMPATMVMITSSSTMEKKQQLHLAYQLDRLQANRQPVRCPQQPRKFSLEHCAAITGFSLFPSFVVTLRLSMPGLPSASTGARTSDRVTR